MSRTSVPKYERVKRVLIREVENGTWTAGSAFPSEAQLLARFDVSRPTLVRSLQELVAEGYLYRQQGRGTFVAERVAREPATSQVPPLTVFLSRYAARLTGPSREVQLRMLRGVQEALGAAYGASLVREVEDGTLDAATRQFVETAPPGVALIVEPSFNRSLAPLLEACGWVVWSINEMTESGNYVCIDQEHAGYLATHCLLQGGRRRIALINGPLEAYWGFAARLSGYQRALQEAGLPVDPRLIRHGAHAIDSEAGRAMMRDLLESDVRPDAVVGASDAKAIGAMSHAREAGIAVPSEIAFVSIDNTLADQVDPPLPSVAMPFEEMGYQAATQARSAAERGSNLRPVHTRISLRPTLIER